jgi:hypothetical protein
LAHAATACNRSIQRQVHYQRIGEEEMNKDQYRIRQRAYEIWEQEGRPHGEELRHWLAAFEELGAGGGLKRGKAAAAASSTPAAKAGKPAAAKTKPKDVGKPKTADVKKTPKSTRKATA